MKVIDLLKQIALKNIPKRIKYNDYEWEYDGENYRIQASSGTYINWDYVVMNCLNEEVEIIEEPQEHKIPEKLDIVLLDQSDNWTRKYNKNLKDFESTHIELNPYVIDVIRQNTLEFQSKINEILDYLEEKE